MSEEVCPNIFRLTVPLPGSPLGALNAYFIRDNGRGLLIDTGMNCDQCLVALRAEFSDLNVHPEQIDFFITHLHPDHVGIVPRLAGENSRVYMGGADVDELQQKDRWAKMEDRALVHGFAEADVREVMPELQLRYHAGLLFYPFTVLHDGDELAYGGYTLQCIHTPGHTPGHLCLYDAQRQIFFAGDHILASITPNISGWLDDGDPLKEYLCSLDKVLSYEATAVFPGHGKPLPSLAGRVHTLKAHHELRSHEVLSILTREGPQTAVEVASHMSWKSMWPSWETFPPYQKWFAGGEALAHLNYLHGTGRVVRKMRGGKVVFQIAW